MRLVGHGTSDNAASYGVYAFGLLPGWTALRDSISLTVYYSASIDFSRSAVVALSQSGRTPDVVEYVERARAGGALTIALTNEPGSELGRAAELVLPLAAGPERAVAASKTYVNELAALALLAGGATGRGREIADGLRRVAALLAEFLPAARAGRGTGRRRLRVRRPDVRRRARPRVRDRARGGAEADRDVPRGSRADDGDRPLARPGRGARPSVSRLDDRLARRDAAARCSTRQRVRATPERRSSPAAARLRRSHGAAYVLPVPDPGERLFTPILSVVPGQLFAASLARVKGLDADSPERLTKVTMAR